jgi:hypothetical protein
VVFDFRLALSRKFLPRAFGIGYRASKMFRRRRIALNLLKREPGECRLFQHLELYDVPNERTVCIE